MKYIAHACLTAVHATGAGVAQAKVAVPFQDSIRRGGSSTEASMSGYGMEGEPSLAPCHPIHHEQATQPRGALRNIGAGLQMQSHQSMQVGLDVNRVLLMDMKCMRPLMACCCVPAGTKKRGLAKGARTKTFDALREKAAAALQTATK